MLAEDFRASPQRVGRMRELLSDPTFAAAIVCLQDEQPKGDVLLGSDAIESARMLSRQAGWSGAISMMLSLAEPLPTEEPEPKATWGLPEEEAAKL